MKKQVLREAGDVDRAVRICNDCRYSYYNDEGGLLTCWVLPPIWTADPDAKDFESGSQSVSCEPIVDPRRPGCRFWDMKQAREYAPDDDPEDLV